MEKIKIGEQYIFNTHGGYEELNDRSGSLVTVLRALTEKEVDIFNVGGVYKIKFLDGYITDAFEDELIVEV